MNRETIHTSYLLTITIFYKVIKLIRLLIIVNCHSNMKHYLNFNRTTFTNKKEMKLFSRLSEAHGIEAIT